jgi:hypothetical protein
MIHRRDKTISGVQDSVTAWRFASTSAWNGSWRGPASA